MDEKSAIVTGSSSGLGLEASEYLLELGYMVFGLSQRGSDIVHSNYFDIVCDLSNEEDIEEFYRQVSETTNSIDVLVHCAGIGSVSPIIETSSREFERNLQVNALGTFHLLKHFSRFIIPFETKVISTVAFCNEQNLPLLAAISASKAAMKAILDSCEVEWRELGVNFSNLYPGPIDTPYWEKCEYPMPKGAVLSTSHFLYVLDMVISSPAIMRFSNIQFRHRGSLV